MTELAPINVCKNQRNEPRLYLECCKVGVSIGNKLCLKKVGRIVRCGIARTLLAELKEANEEDKINDQPMDRQ